MLKKRLHSGKKSIQWVIVWTIVALLIPINLTGFIISDHLVGNMRDKIIDDKHGTVRLFSSQAASDLTAMEDYAYKLISRDYILSFIQAPDSVQYGLARARLWNQMGEMEEFFPEIDFIYVKIHSSGEQFRMRNIRSTTFSESEEVGRALESLKESTNEWELFVIGCKTYFHLNLGNKSYSVGLLLKVDNILCEWKYNQGSLEIISETEAACRRGYFVIAEPFLNNGLQLVNYIPDTDIDSDIPILFYVMICVPFCGLIAVILILVVLQRILMRPLHRMDMAIQVVDNGDISYRIEEFSGTCEFDSIENNFNAMLDQIYHLRIEKYDLELENQKIQMLSLKQQLNPHLLLNSLTTIYSMAETKKTEMIQSFSMNLVQYLRYAYRNTSELVTVRQEIDFVKNYVSIQAVRHPGCFFVMYDIEDEILDRERILPLLVENFVENSTKYAILKDRVIEIDVIIKKDDQGMLIISVCDNGAGMPETVLGQIRKGEPVYDEMGMHIGIWNCIKRLKLFYKDKARMTVTSRPNEGTQIWMCIPGQREEGEDESADCR